MEKVYSTASEAETSDLGKRLSSWLVSEASLHPERNVAVALCGELGGGKTAFVKGCMLGLGYKDEVTSPTFALCRRYDAEITVFHIDLYRLSGYEDLYSAGLLDMDKGAVMLVEWAENACDYMDFDLTVSFAYTDKPDERTITFSKEVLL